MKNHDPMLFQTLKDMQNKKHLPDNFNPFDPGNFYPLSSNSILEPFKSHSCMECGITIYGAKKLLLEHHKVHVQKKRELENEVITGRYLEYQ